MRDDPCSECCSWSPEQWRKFEGRRRYQCKPAKESSKGNTPPTTLVVANVSGSFLPPGELPLLAPSPSGEDSPSPSSFVSSGVEGRGGEVDWDILSGVSSRSGGEFFPPERVEASQPNLTYASGFGLDSQAADISSTWLHLGLPGIPSLEGLVSHLSRAPVTTHNAATLTTTSVTMSGFAKLPMSVASHLDTQVSAAPAMHHAVSLPPGFLAPFTRPGPSYMVTSTLPHVTVPAPFADPGPITIMVPAPRFSTQPGTSSVSLPIPSTLARPSPGCPHTTCACISGPACFHSWPPCGCSHPGNCWPEHRVLCPGCTYCCSPSSCS